MAGGHPWAASYSKIKVSNGSGMGVVQGVKGRRITEGGAWGDAWIGWLAGWGASLLPPCPACKAAKSDVSQSDEGLEVDEGHLARKRAHCCVGSGGSEAANGEKK